jgi:hypothetical protein
MPRQPMLGALVAASAIALVQFARTVSSEPPQPAAPSQQGPVGMPGRPGEADLHASPPPPLLNDLELIAPPGHGPGPGSLPRRQDASPQNGVGRAPRAEPSASAGSAARRGHR